jgi:hypothetical protein
MRQKRVLRYWCDFCKKAGGSAFHMKNHEKHCTLNPDRECKVCLMINDTSKPIPMSELLEILPDPSNYNKEYSEEGHRSLYALTLVALPILRDKVNNCPACIMAALRQKKIPVPMVEEFSFKEEMKSIFADINEERRYNYYWG